MTDPAIVAFLLDEEDLQLSAGITDGFDPADPVCGLCGEQDALGVVFGIAAKGVTGRLCGDCAENVGPFGKTLVDLVDGLESIASATFDSNYRAQVLGLAVRALQWVERASDATDASKAVAA